MYQKDTEKILSELKDTMQSLEFNNRILINEPRKRNKKPCLEDCMHISKLIFKYQEYLNNMWYKGQ